MTKDKKNPRRVTIVVGDVAEALAVADTFTRLGVAAAPILGQTTRERNIQRLHRRLETGGAPAMIAHDHPGFRYLSSACAVDALRGLDAARPLRVSEAPCTRLYPAQAVHAYEDGGRSGPARPPPAAGLPAVEPLSPPPRRPGPHHGAGAGWPPRRAWCTARSRRTRPTPASATWRLACRMSDLIIVDEADRVQMQLDAAFAPSATLVGKSPDSWLDEVQAHKITEFARQGRLQLVGAGGRQLGNAVNTVYVAADKLYALLTQNQPLRNWVVADYFSPFTLHQRLLSSWFPQIRKAERRKAGQASRRSPPSVAERDRVSAVLERRPRRPAAARERTARGCRD